MTKYVIGIGSQRAGSTLLHRILDDCTPIFMHPIKELHYYDTLYGIRHESILIEFSKHQLDRESNRLVIENHHNYIDKKYKCLIRANLLLKNSKVSEIDYLNLYRPCVNDNKFLGEITPEYMILPEEGIKKMSEDLGADAKIILIARNPIERFISAVKLLKLYGNQTFDMNDLEAELLKSMDEMPGWMEVQDGFNDYKTALEKYNRYFSNVLLLSYDQIVNEMDKTHALLQDFLGFNVNKSNLKKTLQKKVNPLAKTGDISEYTRKILIARYEMTIQFLEDKFGANSCIL